MKIIWEEFLAFELEHLRIASDLIKKHEKRDPEEIIGNEIIEPCHFESQKEYVANILINEVDKRLDGTDDKSYTTIDKLSDNWPSYEVQEKFGEDGAPTEKTIQLITTATGRDIVFGASKLIKKQSELIERGLEEIAQAPDTVSADDYRDMESADMVEF